MKVLLLVALIGAAVANHVPGHVDFVYARHADAVPSMFTESFVDQPVVVVTRMTRVAPEMVAILVEKGINHMPESLDSFHDLMRSTTSESEEFMLCNGGIEGRLDFCMEKPIVKLLVPEVYKDMSVARLINAVPAMPWVHMPVATRSIAPSILSDMEVFDKPILIVRAVPISEEVVPEEHIMKSLYNVPLNNFNVKYFTDDSFAKSFKPLSRSASPAYWSLMKSAYLPKFVGQDTEVVSPLEFTRFHTPSHYKSFDNIDLVKSIKPIVKYDEIIAKPILKNFDTIIEKPIYKNFDVIEKPLLKNFDTIIEKPFLKNYDTIIESPILKNYGAIIEKPIFKNYDTIIEKPILKSFMKPLLKNYDAVIANPNIKAYTTVFDKPILKNFDTIIEKPILKHYDEILAKPFLKDYVSVNPLYKNFHLVDTPAVLPVTRSFLPKVAYETLY